METEEGRHSRLLKEKAEVEAALRLCYPKDSSNPKWVILCVLLAAAEVTLKELEPRSIFDGSLCVAA